MTKALARALGPETRMLAVSPGAVDTGFVAGRGRDQLEKMAQSMPMKKVTEADDVALAVLAAVTHLRQTTGSIITVDAGRHL
jgi:3-oxoacyl-[acyl-carrier protein] reductase